MGRPARPHALPSWLVPANQLSADAEPSDGMLRAFWKIATGLRSYHVHGLRLIHYDQDP